MSLLKFHQWPIAFIAVSKVLSRSCEALHGLALANLSPLASFQEPSIFFKTSSKYKV